MIKSPYSSRHPKDFRILLFYPNLHMSALMPQSMGIFTALLKQDGYTLDIFDCTYYQDIDSINLGKNANNERVDNRNAPAFSNDELVSSLRQDIKMSYFGIHCKNEFQIHPLYIL